MSKKFRDALDQGLSGMVFDERMQRSVMQQIRAQSAKAQPRQPLLSARQFLSVAAVFMLLVVGAIILRTGGTLPGDVGDPVNTPPVIANQPDFVPIVTASPVPGATGEPMMSIPLAVAEDATPSPTPTATPSPTPTATPTATPSPTPDPTFTPTPEPEMATRTDLTPTAGPTEAAAQTDAPTGTPSPTPTATPSATPSPSPTPTVTPTATPSPSPTPTATPSATPSPSPTPTATPTIMPTATPSPSPTAPPAPTATPNPDQIVFEDERIVVTTERCENDMFYVFTDLRVAVKDASRYVLATSADQAPDDGREVILLTPRMECVTNNLTAGLKSFDMQDTASASYRLFSQLEQSVYHMTCFDLESVPQADGSILLRGVGDAVEMQNIYDDGMVILTALTFSDQTGQTGRREIIYQNLPAAPRSLRSVSYHLGSKLEGYDLIAAELYYQDGYAYLSVKYNLTGTLPVPDAVRLSAADYPAADGLRVQIAHHKDEYLRYSGQYPEIITSEYERVLFRLDSLTSDTDVFYPTLTFLAGEDTAFTVALVSNRVGDVHGPTATPAGLPAATPAPDAVPSAVSDIPLKTLSIPDGMKVLLQTDWYTILQGDGWFDGLMTECSVLVLPNDPSQYVLSTDGVAAEFPGRTVLPLELTLDAYNAASLSDSAHQARLQAVITPAEQGGLQFDFSAFPLVGSGSILYLSGSARLTDPSGAVLTSACTASLRKDTQVFQIHLQKPRTGIEGVSIVQGALYVTDRHSYVRFTYDERTSDISPVEFHAVKINGDPVTTYGFATTRHSTQDGYLISWGIVDYFTRSTSPTTVIEVIDPATGESLGSFECTKPTNGYW